MRNDISIQDPNNVKKSEEKYPQFMFRHLLLGDGEFIVKAVRKHWVVFRDSFLIAFFIPFLLIFISVFVSTPFINLPKLMSEKISIIPLYIAFISFLIGFSMFLIRLFLWYNTFYIITNKRLVKIEQENLFNSKVHQMYFNKVQDAICKISGIEAILYGYGDISIQGASETAQISFTKVANPKKIQQIIAFQAGKGSQDL